MERLIPIDVLNNLINRDLARDLREQISYMRTLVKAITEVPSPDLVMEILSTKFKINQISESVDPTYLGYTQSLEGEVDDLQEINHKSFVAEDGAIDGPRYSGANGEWLMSEEHVRARETRWENGEPEDYNKRPLNTSRMRHDDEDSQSDDEFSILFTRRGALDFQTYHRDGQFFENIRILTQRNGQPLSVMPDWAPEEEHEDIVIPLTEEIDQFVTEQVKLYTNQGNVRTRVRRVDCALMQDILAEMRLRKLKAEKTGEPEQQLPQEILRGFYSCAAKLDKANTFQRTRKAKAKIPVLDSNKRQVFDEMGKPVYRTKKVKKLVKGGIPFKGSYQLSPVPGYEYSTNPNNRYAVVGLNAQSLLKRFHEMNGRGELKTCTCIEYRGKERYKKRQAYAVMPFKIGDVMRHFVVFTDLRPWRN